jgi:hypothetical protein
MKYNGSEETLFEKDSILVDVCSKFIVLKKHFEKEMIPPLEINYQKELTERYRIEMTIEEIIELRDFIENGEFSDWQSDRIDEDYSKGMSDIDMSNI